jgi:two-component system LytT family response regulator
MSNRKSFTVLRLTSAKETRFIRTQDIIRCESSNNYTTFFLFGREKIMTSKPIFEYEEILANYGLSAAINRIL